MLASERKKRFVLGEDDMKEVVDAFDLFDPESTGKIGYHELKTAIRALGFETKKEEVLQHIQDQDVEGVGALDKEQFVKIMTKYYARRDPEDEIAEAFRLFDRDESGRISLRNVRRIAKELGEDLSEEELQAMIDEFDRDQDGEINLQEFTYIMKQTNVF